MSAQQIIYVDDGAPGGGGGTGWADAYADLQVAIDAAAPADEVWVAAGVYAGIHLRAGVAIYGGFSGTESSRDQREVTTNETVIGGGLLPGDNHLVSCIDVDLDDDVDLRDVAAFQSLFDLGI